MFRIAFTVRDKLLADILKSLDGKAFNLEVMPVKEAVKTTRQAAGAWLDSVPSTFAWAQAKQAIGSHSGTSNYIRTAIASKKVKKIGRGRYAKI